jgi:hypothetical protein
MMGLLLMLPILIVVGFMLGLGFFLAKRLVDKAK